MKQSHTDFRVPADEEPFTDLFEFISDSRAKAVFREEDSPPSFPVESDPGRDKRWINLDQGGDGISENERNELIAELRNIMRSYYSEKHP